LRASAARAAAARVTADTAIRVLQVFLHYSIVSIPGGEVLHSTRVESGGPGQPQPFVVGGGAARPLRGVEIALLGMRPLERCMLELKPEYAYAHKDCTEVPPRGQRRDARVGVDVQLARWCPGGGAVRAVDAAPGVIRRTLAPGQGWETPRAPFEVTLHVEARALASDGADAGGPAFFSTAAAPGGGGGEPLVVSLGSGALPPGLDAAVCGMLRGETATVWCPAGAVRGGAAVPPPPDAALRFVQYQVRLLDFLQVRDLLGDGAATKRTLTKGRGEFPADCPLEDAAVRMHLRVRAAGAAAWVWDSRTAAEGAPAEAGLAQSSRGPEPGGDAAGEGAGAALVVETGTGALPECLDAAVRLMLRGEVSSVRSEWSRAYAGREDAPAGLPPGGAVEFELELVDFEAEANLAEADAAAKLARAATWREQGNAVFRAGRWRLAKQKYLKGLRCVGQALDIETEEQAAAAAALKAACLVNLAACAHKEEAYGEAISWCTKAIK
jgi:FK506-binding protein 4/5